MNKQEKISNCDQVIIKCDEFIKESKGILKKQQFFLIGNLIFISLYSGFSAVLIINKIYDYKIIFSTFMLLFNYVICYSIFDFTNDVNNKIGHIDRIKYQYEEMRKELRHQN